MLELDRKDSTVNITEQKVSKVCFVLVVTVLQWACKHVSLACLFIFPFLQLFSHANMHHNKEVQCYRSTRSLVVALSSFCPPAFNLTPLHDWQSKEMAQGSSERHRLLLSNVHVPEVAADSDLTCEENQYWVRRLWNKFLNCFPYHRHLKQCSPTNPSPLDLNTL